MSFTCDKCHCTFINQRNLRLHELRKRPCDLISEYKCMHCSKCYTRSDAVVRHQKVCASARTAAIAAQLADVQARLNEIEQRAPIALGSINNGLINTGTVNINIAPWGTPLQLTDRDVESALLSVPGLAGTPELTEVVAALMELVKLAHVPQAARNVHINARRTDQALALTPGGWAALPLEEATKVLFDGASARMEAVRTPGAQRAVRELIPVQYREERAGAVQMGMRPMGAHLQNIAPGGPGPLTLGSGAVPVGLAPQDAAALLRAHPAPPLLNTAWLAQITAAAGVGPTELVRALRQASAQGHCGTTEWQGIMRMQRDAAGGDAAGGAASPPAASP